MIHFKMIFMKINKFFLLLAFLFATLQTFAQTYTYDNLNRLTKVVYDNGATVSYTYDALGNRTSKKVTGVTAQTFTVTVAVTPEGSGTVTGGGTYAKGTSVELNAIANAGFEFVKWSDGETANPRSVIVDSNLSFTAQFKEVQSTMAGDITGDGKVNAQDLNALVEAYLTNAQVTDVTDLDNDSQLSMADITKLISMIYSEPCAFDNNGHAYVDLGLPSGTLWATCNIGANAPEEAGGLYAWGETEEKEDYSWSTYKWCNGDACDASNKTLTKYCDREGYGTMDGKMSLELEDDVANVKWGGDWHIPTEAEMQELVDNCTIEEITLDAGSVTKGFKFTGANGNSIILPFAGYRNGTSLSNNRFYYWTTDIKNKYCTQAYHLQSSKKMAGGYRYRGYSVRPVLSNYTPVVHPTEAPSSYLNHALVDLGLPSGTLWATCNVGASTPEGYGCYFAWGDTESSCDGISDFSETTYKYYSASGMTKYTEPGALESGDDAATAKWGGKWRMPTQAEITELESAEYTTYEWTTVNGVYGIRVTSIVEGYQGNSIFLPAAGYYKGNQLKDVGEQGLYWGSTIRSISDTPTYTSADCIRLGEDYLSKGSLSRWRGYSVRPVVKLSDIDK